MHFQKELLRKVMCEEISCHKYSLAYLSLLAGAGKLEVTDTW